MQGLLRETFAAWPFFLGIERIGALGALGFVGGSRDFWGFRVSRVFRTLGDLGV